MAEDKSTIGHAERVDRWAVAYHDLLDPHAVLAALVEAAGDYLALILGEEAVDRGMTAMLREGFGNLESPWRTALANEEFNLWAETSLGNDLFDAGAYAHYGVGPSSSGDLDDRTEAVRAMVENAAVFLRRSPLEAWLDPDDAGETLLGRQDGPFGLKARGAALKRLVMLADNRWALDNDRPIEVAALAHFGGVSEARIQNMAAGANRTFNKDADGRIPAHEALAWLDGRESFWPSIWRAEHDEQDIDQGGGKPLSDPIFIPVARDGTAFNPGLLRNGSFTVGPKGDEAHVARFDEALARLQAAPSPYWRRPNENGAWGIVRGVHWERMDRADLDAFLRNPRRRVVTQG
jgi:hypothetical protein